MAERDNGQVVATLPLSAEVSGRNDYIYTGLRPELTLLVDDPLAT